METTSQSTSDIDHRASAIGATQYPAHQPDDDDPFNTFGAIVTDGFGSQSSSATSSSAMTPSPSMPTQTVSPLHSPAATPQPPPPAARPATVTKSVQGPLPEDNSFHRISGYPRPVTRTSTMSTDQPIIQFERPYNGPSGPSHPYQMYPQNVRAARGMSIATTSTEPISDTQPHGIMSHAPSHPYGLYTQSTSEAGPSTSTSLSTTNIPVGFPGYDQAPYQRRLGPDGEDIDDIIGPDGHTEELPPYSVYPPVLSYKAPALAAAAPSGAAGLLSLPSASIMASSSRSTSGVSEPSQSQPLPALEIIQGAGGVGLATRNPEFDSPNDLTHSSRNSSRLDLTREESTPQAALVSEKEPESARKRWGWDRKTGLAGLARSRLFWLILIAAALICIILGAVVGTALSQDGKKPPPPKGGDHHTKDDSSDGDPTAHGANPIPTPDGLTALSGGQFILPLSLQKASDTCFEDRRQFSAWSCNLTSTATLLLIDIRQCGENGSVYEAAINREAPSAPAPLLGLDYISYGPQPPSYANYSPLILVNDTFEPDLGPAWLLTQQYTKTVILPSDALNSNANGSRVSSRDIYHRSSTVTTTATPATPGSRAWVCSWPDTWIELFIYPERNNSLSDSMMSNIITSNVKSAIAADASTTSGPRSSLVARLAEDDLERLPEFRTLSALAPSVDTTGDLGDDHGDNGDGSSQSTVTSSAIATSTNPVVASSSSVLQSVVENYTPLRQAMKLGERRIDGSGAFCQLVEIQDNATTRPVMDSSGNAIKVDIDEQDGDDEGSVNEMSSCGCVWLVD